MHINSNLPLLRLKAQIHEKKAFRKRLGTDDLEELSYEPGRANAVISILQREKSSASDPTSNGPRGSESVWLNGLSSPNAAFLSHHSRIHG